MGDAVEEAIMRWIQPIVDRQVKKLQKIYDRGYEKAKPAIGNAQEKIIGEMYAEEIWRFYEEYTPKRYLRKYSLLNMMIMKTRENRTVESVFFDPGKMSGYRNGDHSEGGLYTTVFREGYHGGAKSGDQTVLKNGTVLDTPHPDPNHKTPYWRAGKHFLRWGRRAVKSETPPLKRVQKRYDGLGNTNSVDRIRLVNEIENIASKYINDELRAAISGGEF